jgi:hypothetical protein
MDAMATRSRELPTHVRGRVDEVGHGVVPWKHRLR